MFRTQVAGLSSSALIMCASRVSAREVPVQDAPSLVAAVADARAGDVITLAAGAYRVARVRCGAAGTREAPIVVRSAVPLGARIQVDGIEGFAVTGAHWRFEGLDVTGVCARDADCEHAFHVTGAADGFVLRDGRVFDFNAQLKVNAAQVAGAWRAPNGGLVQGNELGDAHARDTGNPVTKLNIDTGEGWVVRANYIHDAHKAGGDGISYAAFMKSGGRDGTFERNLVICARDDLTGGVRIGLSFGGGGTGAQFCAPAFDPAAPCDPEHSGGTMRNNVIVGCSDVGIYLNKARDTKLLFNTLIATGGIDFRFPSSTGEADGNVLAGKIRAREGGTFTAGTNLTDLTAFDDWYVSPSTGDLRRKGDLSTLLEKAEARPDVADDYCARERPGTRRTLGALEHALGDCDTTRPPAPFGGLADAGSADDAGADGAAEAGVGAAHDGSAQDDHRPESGPARGGASGCSASGGSAWGAWGAWGALALVLRGRRRGGRKEGARRR